MMLAGMLRRRRDCLTASMAVSLGDNLSAIIVTAVIDTSDQQEHMSTLQLLMCSLLLTQS